MTIEANKEAMRAFFSRVVGNGEVDVMDQIATEDFQYHDGDHHVTSAAEMKEVIQAYRVALADLQANVVEVFGEGDRMATRVDFTGKHVGELMGVGATDRPVNFTLTMVSRFAGGKISEVWINWVALAVLEQIGGYERSH